MAVALLGYFTTMVTAFVGFMVLLNTVLSSGLVQQAHPRRPYPMPAIAEAVVPDKPPASSTQTARVEAPKEAPKPVVAAKTKHVKVAARDQRRKQDFAERQQDNRDYVMGMRYAQGGTWQPDGNGLFGQFGTGRF